MGETGGQSNLLEHNYDVLVHDIETIRNARVTIGTVDYSLCNIF